MPGANFYFLNPSGVMFGPEASIDVDGTFHVSTAESLEFSNGESFGAFLGGSVPVLDAAPTQFGFLGDIAARITVDGSLLDNRGGVVLAGGTVELLNGGVVSTSTSDGDAGGDITVIASEHVLISGFDPGGFASGLVAETSGNGDAGNITVQAPIVEIGGWSPHLDFRDRKRCQHRNRGGISIEASERFTVAGYGAQRSAVEASTETDGDAGSIRISSPLVEIKDGAVVQTSTSKGTGNAEPSTSSTAASSSCRTRTWRSSRRRRSIETSGGGNAGTITVDAREIRFEGGARATTSTTSSSGGAGGDIVLTATESISLSGRSSVTNAASELIATTSKGGPAGSILIEAPNVTLEDGARIVTSTFGPGPGGLIQLQGTGADESVLSLGGRSFIGADSNSSGQAGDVVVSGFGHLELTQSTISTNASGSGPAGSIVIDAQHVDLADESEISSSSTGSAQAGSITVGRVRGL